ncbi:MAG: type II toxin-antitoxin system VapC family toxin [Candidatus Aminicenantes bacterium]|nr:type II toxin-antitoxin system VapC family toxin [Candidatus Aminicenantes bacterium]
MIVVDTNIRFYLFAESDKSGLAERVLEKDREWLGPSLWRSEFRNALVKSIRNKLMDLGSALRIMAVAEAIMPDDGYDVASDDIIDLAAASGCSAYDAEFVVMARDLRVPLVTTDRELLEKFPETAISPERFLAR